MKLSFFLIVRLVLSIFSAYAEKRFIHATQQVFGFTVALNAAMFMLLSPGVFMCSVAFLPSAVSMSIVLLAVSFWMENRFVASIAMGCIAVFWTGWPFVAVLFVPLGLHMIIASYFSSEEKDAMKNVLSLFYKGIITLIVVAAPAAAIDFFMYKKWLVNTFICMMIIIFKTKYIVDRVSPTLNILLYNVLGGNGDELYGTEPISYYIRNLFLNMSTAWLLFPIFPIWFFHHYYWNVSSSSPVNTRGLRSPFYIALTISASACSWLLLLFTRPHKASHE